MIEPERPGARRPPRHRTPEGGVVMRKIIGAGIAALVLLLALMAGATASGSGGKDVLDWDVMAPVDGPFVGTGTPVRGVPGGGLPWELDRARGELRSDGRLKVRVEGLVLAR